MSNVMIVESPNKIKKLQSILGDGWIVKASVGHIMDLPLHGLGIDIENDFQIDLQFIPDKKIKDKTFNGGLKRVKSISAVIKGNKVYLASDPDREGESISANLQQALHLKNDAYDRVTFDEVTPTKVLNALKNPRKIDYNLVKAQETRRALDRIFGYLVSPLVSKALNTNASAGRVQSVAVRLVVDREKSILAFKKVNHFSAVIEFDNTWSAEWNTKNFLKNDEPYILDKDLAEKAASFQKFRVSSKSNTIKYVAPPGCFSSSDLMQAASNSLNIDAATTMKLAQSLFEQGYISYHRTDQVNIGDEFFEELKKYANNHQLPIVNQRRTFKVKGEAQEAHEAIRPTHIEEQEAGNTDLEKALYNLIRQRTIASQLEDAEFSENLLILEALDDTSFKYNAKSRQIIKAGWQSFMKGDQTLDEQDKIKDDDNIVPLLDEGVEIQATKGKVLFKETQPLNRFSEATLIKKLEADGIGRPSTFANIMQNILTRNYIKIDPKRKLIPTDIGIKLVDFLMASNFSFIDIKYTKTMEDQLDLITQGKLTYLEVIRPAYDALIAEINKIKAHNDFTPLHTCNKCGSGLTRIINKTSKVPYWRCDNNDCITYFDDDDGKPVERLTSECPKCKGVLKRLKNERNQFYWRCSNVECKHYMLDDKGIPKDPPIFYCEKCNSPLRQYNKKPPQKGKGWVCTNKDCNTWMDDSNGKPIAQKSKTSVKK